MLPVDQEQTENWDYKEVACRWQQLFKMPVIVSRWLRSEIMTNPELTVVFDVINEWRDRYITLADICVSCKENIAREANRENDVIGRFWEGRFKSQSLLDEQAMIVRMAYVDLKPDRADMAKTPEMSDYTSIQIRMKAVLDKKTAHCCLLKMKGIK